MAVEETLRLGAELSRRLDGLRPGIFEMPALMGMPLRRWAARKASQAYYHGFIQGLAQNPKATMLAIVNNPADVNNDTDSYPGRRGH